MTAANSASEAAVVEEATPYELVGGEEGVRRLAERFYAIMDQEPGASRIRAMHDADLGPIKQLLFEYLSGWLGGPPLYFERTEHRCIMSAHRPYPIGDTERDEWMMCMRRAMLDCDITGDMYQLLDQAFLRMANAFRTRKAG